MTKTTAVARMIILDTISARANQNPDLPSMASYMRKVGIEVSEKHIAQVCRALLAIRDELSASWR